MKVFVEGVAFELEDGMTLLDGLLHQQVAIPFGCKTGTCHSCLLYCTQGCIPETSQIGLRETQKLNRMILACQCIPTGDLHVRLPDSENQRLSAKVHGIKALNHEVIELTLRPERPIDYRAGQFIRLFHPEGDSRCYSLASVPSLDNNLVLHVRTYPGGHLSQWIRHQLRTGDQVTLTESMGECFYVEGKPEQPLLLIGTGTGLAPLFGILRDALDHGHLAPIHLYHGARAWEDLYLTEELRQLSNQHPALTCHFCISDPSHPIPDGCRQGRASDLALADFPELKGWSIYLCGNPDMVRSTQMQAFLAGASLENIHADPFEAQRPQIPSVV